MALPVMPKLNSQTATLPIPTKRISSLRSPVGLSASVSAENDQMTEFQRQTIRRTSDTLMALHDFVVDDTQQKKQVKKEYVINVLQETLNSPVRFGASPRSYNSPRNSVGAAVAMGGSSVSLPQSLNSDTHTVTAEAVSYAQPNSPSLQPNHTTHGLKPSPLQVSRRHSNERSNSFGGGAGVSESSTSASVNTVTGLGVTTKIAVSFEESPVMSPSQLYTGNEKDALQIEQCLQPSHAAYEQIRSVIQSPISISRRFIGQAEWNQLGQLTDFSEIELGQLNMVFVIRQTGGLLSRRSFWDLIALGHGIVDLRGHVPLVADEYCLSNQAYLRLYLEENSLLAARMFSIFDVMKRNSLTFLEFTLAFAVMCGKAEKKFLDRISFSFDVFDLRQDQRISLDEISLCAVTTAVHQRRSGQPPSPVDAYTAGVTQAVSTMYSAAFACTVQSGHNQTEAISSASSASPNINPSTTPASLSREDYVHMVHQFPQIMEPFSIYFEEFVDQVSLRGASLLENT